ncbi:BTB/POZ domain-containing protein At5g48800 isoform X1 [Selaginella moellendorffii]|nr:BTB/POZ domain-containing protein At5g48800 isoform X1 [Selaginella moellendorffii]|eukprot:XP_002970426.2 BTB/POZ domain-containing protein At5g48800 isoform X1 [Selaginella moellendorffii]
MTLMGKVDKFSAMKRSTVSSAAKRTAEWVMSTDVPTDVLVEAGGVSFALHKFPLVSRSGKIRKLVAGDSRELDVSFIKLSDLPGGPEAFELAAKFCYGINFEISVTNVATLRCAAEYLDMTEDYGDGNLVARTEAFIDEIATQNLSNAVAVLHSCESLLPLAEELKIVNRCVDAAATEVCREQLSSLSSHTDFSNSERMETLQPKGPVDWWAEDLSILRIDFYQRVLAAMMSRGLRHETIGAALMHYAHRALKGFNRKQVARDSSRTKLKVHDSATAIEHEQRILVETIVSMLPREKNSISCSFLFGLLRTALILDTTMACRIDLEQRIGMQLERATLDDLLVPAFSYSGDTLFDVDIIHRIVVSFLKQESDDNKVMYESDGGASPSQSALMRVAKLMDGYLAEVAPDPNLKVSKFIALAELFPDHARLVDDSLYRAVDIYLKAHPALSDLERKKLCKLLDVQKLSQEACQHAAQNERLPVQMVVQVLYYEQMRLRTAMTTSFVDGEQVGPYSQKAAGPGGLSAAISPRDHYSSIRRENRELKLEVARMRMRLTDLEKDHVNMKEGIQKTGSSSKFLSSVTKTLSKLNPFRFKDSSNVPNAKSGMNSRRRRHSIS